MTSMSQQICHMINQSANEHRARIKCCCVAVLSLKSSDGKMCGGAFSIVFVRNLFDVARIFGQGFVVIKSALSCFKTPPIWLKRVSTNFGQLCQKLTGGLNWVERGVIAGYLTKHWQLTKATTWKHEIIFDGCSFEISLHVHVHELSTRDAHFWISNFFFRYFSSFSTRSSSICQQQIFPARNHVCDPHQLTEYGRRASQPSTVQKPPSPGKSHSHFMTS